MQMGLLTFGLEQNIFSLDNTKGLKRILLSCDHSFNSGTLPLQQKVLTSNLLFENHAVATV